MSLVDVSLALGDEVTLFGISPTVCDLADCSQMIPYEILCNAGAHAKREYLG